MNPINPAEQAYFILHPDNFIAPECHKYFSNNVIQVHNYAEAIEKATELYQIPEAFGVQLWSSPLGVTTRHRVDTLNHFEEKERVLSIWVKVVKKTPPPGGGEAPVGLGQAAVRTPS